MHILSAGRLRMRKSIYYPGARDDETFELPVLSALFKHRQGNVLFDTGCHPEVARDPVARWGAPMTRLMGPIFSPEDAVVHQLPKAGLTADDVDVVVCSHLHPDHCGCNTFFKRATLIAHELEMKVARAADAGSMGYLRQEWDHGGAVDELSGDRDLFGDGKINLVHAPGHTAGSIVAVASLDRDGEFVIASDAAPVRESLDKRLAPTSSWNIDKTIAVVDELARMETKGATVIFGHDEAQWRTLKTGGEYYE